VARAADGPGPVSRIAILRVEMGRPDKYRLRAPASGREVVISIDGDRPGDEVAYYDRQTGERMEIVSELLPLSDSASALPRTPENLRICPHCGELVGVDLSECPHCLRRLPALGERS
jgi:hypothetical protein